MNKNGTNNMVNRQSRKKRVAVEKKQLAAQENKLVEDAKKAAWEMRTLKDCLPMVNKAQKAITNVGLHTTNMNEALKKVDDDEVMHTVGEDDRGPVDRNAIEEKVKMQTIQQVKALEGCKKGVAVDRIKNKELVDGVEGVKNLLGKGIGINHRRVAETFRVVAEVKKWNRRTNAVIPAPVKKKNGKVRGLVSHLRRKLRRYEFDSAREEHTEQIEVWRSGDAPHFLKLWNAKRLKEFASEWTTILMFEEWICDKKMKGKKKTIFMWLGRKKCHKTGRMLNTMFASFCRPPPLMNTRRVELAVDGAATIGLTKIEISTCLTGPNTAHMLGTRAVDGGRQRADAYGIEFAWVEKQDWWRELAEAIPNDRVVQRMCSTGLLPGEVTNKFSSVNMKKGRLMRVFEVDQPLLFEFASRARGLELLKRVDTVDSFAKAKGMKDEIGSSKGRNLNSAGIHASCNNNNDVFSSSFKEASCGIKWKKVGRRARGRAIPRDLKNCVEEVKLVGDCDRKVKEFVILPDRIRKVLLKKVKRRRGRALKRESINRKYNNTFGQMQLGAAVDK